MKAIGFRSYLPDSNSRDSSHVVDRTPYATVLITAHGASDLAGWRSGVLAGQSKPRDARFEEASVTTCGVHGRSFPEQRDEFIDHRYPKGELQMQLRILRTLAGLISGQRWIPKWVLVVVTGILAVSWNASAQPFYALEYWGGPVLENFQIYPLYYGDWSSSEIAAQQAYLTTLKAYISGQNAPASQQPMIRQYGVYSATVVAAETAKPSATPRTLTRADVLKIIQNNQSNGKLPAFGPNSLLMVFPAHGFTLQGCTGCSYHASESNTAFWAVVPADSGPNMELVTAHEVFEAATDPVVNDSASWGWLTGAYYPAGSSSLAHDEMVDECGNFTITLSNLGIQIPEAIDNTAGVTVGNPSATQPPGGVCSTTGYTSLNEIQVYGWTYADYRAEYNTLWTEGWRLYSLQSYVLSTGAVCYNAVWRPSGNTSEIQDYGVSLSKFQSDYNNLYPQGWRVYILQSYVMPGGDVLYNAVWRPGDMGETQAYGVTLAEFQSQYNTLYPEGWRVNLLQSYVMSNGDVLYNAVWRPGITGEQQVYGYTYSDFRAEYNILFPEGWRLYILDSYVISDGTVRYNAVWRPGTHAETQVYDWTYSDFRNEYNTLFPEGWRLYILNAYVLPGDQVNYDAVWRQGTIDRPL
jgi:hypothetical protein